MKKINLIPNLGQNLCHNFKLPTTDPFSFDLLNHQLYVKHLTSWILQPSQNDPSFMASGRIDEIYYFIFSHRPVCPFFLFYFFYKEIPKVRCKKMGHSVQTVRRTTTFFNHSRMGSLLWLTFRCQTIEVRELVNFWLDQRFWRFSFCCANWKISCIYTKQLICDEHRS